MKETFPVHEQDPKKDQKNKYASIPKKIKNFGIASLFAVSSLVGSAQDRWGKNNDETKTESTSYEKQKEDFLQYLDYLKNKSDTSQVTPEEMDIYAAKWG